MSLFRPQQTINPLLILVTTLLPIFVFVDICKSLIPAKQICQKRKTAKLVNSSVLAQAALNCFINEARSVAMLINFFALNGKFEVSFSLSHKCWYIDYAFILGVYSASQNVKICFT